MMDLTPQDIDAVTRTVAAEAGNQAPIGQQAVAHVILNRAAASGMSPADVVAAKGQFEGYAKGQQLDPKSPAYQGVMKTVMPVISGAVPDPTQGATHYLNPELQAKLGRPQPAWAPPDSGQRIGDHVFYKGGYDGREAKAAVPGYDELVKAGVFAPRDTEQAAPAESGAKYAQPSQSSSLPSYDDLAKAGVFAPRSSAPAPAKPPAAQATPDDPEMAAARQDAKANANIPRAARGAYNAANAVLLGAGPMESGAIMAAKNVGQHALASLGVGQAPAYGPGAAFKANMEEQQAALRQHGQDHPIENAAENVGGFIASGLEGGAGRLIEKGVQGAAEKLAPKVLTSGAGRLATRAAGSAAVAGTAGTNEGLASGESVPAALGTGAESAALAAPLHVVGEGATALAPLIKSAAARKAIMPAVGAGIGAGTAALTGHNPGEGAVTGGALGLMAGRGAKVHPDIEPTPTDRAVALQALAKAHGESVDGAAAPTAAAETLDAAHPQATTAEALGQPGEGLYKEALKGGTAGSTMADTLQARQDATHARLAADLRQTTGIDPATAQLDSEARVDQARNGPVKQAYDAALTGRGVWTPELQQLHDQEPVFRDALNRAMNRMGERGSVLNPNFGNSSGPSNMPARMSVEEFRAAQAQANGKAPGSPVTNEDIAALVKGQTAAGAGYVDPMAKMQRIPTDLALDRAKRYVDMGYNSPDPNARVDAKEVGQKYRDVLDRPDVLGEPYVKARSLAGDYISDRQATEAAPILGARGASAETQAAFAKRFNALTPAEQQATRAGTMARVYKGLEDGSLNMEHVASNPRDRGILETMFPGQADRITSSFQREADFAKAAKTLSAKGERATPEQEEHTDLALPIGMSVASHGLNLMSAARNVASHIGVKKGADLIQAIRAGKMTPGVRNALGDILAQSPHQTARELRELHSARRNVRMSSKSGLRESNLASHALAGLTTAAATGGATALDDLRGRLK